MGLPITGHSFFESQVVEETKELIPGSIAFEFAIQRFRFIERLLLHRQCGLQINGSYPKSVIGVEGF
jgi:hypothetical protein